MAEDAGMNHVVPIPDHALLRLVCKSETGDQTMYDVDQTLVDELAYLMESPKDERPGIFCLGREWILTGRTMGGLSLSNDKRDLQFCWSGGWFVILESGNDSMNLLGPLACFSIPIRDAIFEYQEREEKRSLYTPWLIEAAAKANGYLIEEFKRLPQYQQRGMLLDEQCCQREKR
jgi:hypothetical protein